MARAFTNNGNIYARGKQGGPNVSMRDWPTYSCSCSDHCTPLAPFSVCPTMQWDTIGASKVSLVWGIN